MSRALPARAAFAVLITRPEPQASRFAAALSDALPGRVQPVLSPLMAAEFLPVPLPPGRFAALVLTSETGAEAAIRLRMAGADLPSHALCVGDQTAAAARAAGFDAVSAKGDAGDLLALILSEPDPGPMLYLHGRDRAADLARGLYGQRQLHAVAAYVQNPLPLTPEARQVLAKDAPVLLPVFSPRSARLLAAALPTHRLADLWPVTISEKTRKALPPALADHALVATRPDGTAMIQAIARLLALPMP